ncbi:MAG: dihydroorotate dehydrogenase-like protein [Chloroflexi bacterium]|nr:dihydroorotate dehydrogenase-like protein [Chloroflexota bacterium]
MADLSTYYLGLHIKNPLVVAASPLSAHVDNIKRMAAAGAAAVVLPSLFEEQIELHGLGFDLRPPEDRQDLPAALRHIPNMKEYNQGASGYLVHIYQAKRAVNIPVIASLNGYYSGGWVQYARLIEAAGADALELNIYYLATKPHITSEDVERMYLNLVKDVKASVSIPVAVKLNPYFSALANMATRLSEAGADGLIFFNRFYQPDFDIEEQHVVSSLDLSSSNELRIRLRWVAILNDIVQSDLAITGGVHTATDMIKSIMAGAKAVEIVSVLLQHGIEHISLLLDDLTNWLDDKGYASLEKIRGTMSQEAVTDPSAFARANYMNVLKSMNE